MIQFNASLIYTIINLVIFYLLLKKFLFKPVMGIMEKREKMIADGLQNATDTQNEAKQLKADYEKALSGAKEQSSQIVDKAHAEAKKEYNRILSEANEKAGIMLENAKKTIEVERQQTMNTLQSEIAGLAMQAAKKIVDEKTENQGNKGIYDQFLEGVGEAMETQTLTKRMYRSSMSGHYARVLYELNVPKTDIEKTKEAFAEVPQLREVFINPTISAKIKMSVIDQVFPESMKNFLKVVCKNQRVNLINEIFDAYDEYCDEQAHILTAVLACVEPPSEEQLDKMKVFLCDKYQKADVKIQIVEDKSLLGGFILHVENDEYDWSLKGRLTRLEQKLTWR